MNPNMFTLFATSIRAKVPPMTRSIVRSRIVVRSPMTRSIVRSRIVVRSPMVRSPFPLPHHPDSLPHRPAGPPLTTLSSLVSPQNKGSSREDLNREDLASPQNTGSSREDLNREDLNRKLAVGSQLTRTEDDVCFSLNVCFSLVKILLAMFGVWIFFRVVEDHREKKKKKADEEFKRFISDYNERSAKRIVDNVSKRLANDVEVVAALNRLVNDVEVVAALKDLQKAMLDARPPEPVAAAAAPAAAAPTATARPAGGEVDN